MEIIKQFPWSAIKIVEQNPFVFSAFTVRLSELAFLENSENKVYRDQHFEETIFM